LEAFADLGGIQIGLLPVEFAKSVRLIGQARLRATAATRGSEGARFAMALHEPADKGRTDGEALGHFGSGLTSLPRIENALAKVRRDCSHRAILGTRNERFPLSVHHRY
jgi:hypothetical protein